MMKFFNWLFRRKPKPTPEQKAGLVAAWKKVPEEDIEDLPALVPTLVKFSEDYGRSFVDMELKGILELEDRTIIGGDDAGDWLVNQFLYGTPTKPTVKGLIIDPDIETDKKY